MRAFAVLVAGGLAFSSSAFAASENPSGAPERVYDGRAVYGGAGAGLILGVGEPTASARIAAVFALSDWIMLEGHAIGYRFTAKDHHGDRDDSSGLGIGAGIRVAPSPDLPVRPYAAVRAVHIHFWPDIWGPHEDEGEGVEGHHSVHRFGGALALGADARLGGKSSPFRLSVEAEGLALSGPVANGFVQAAVALGYAF